MKKSIINLFRKSPASMGLLSLLIALHLVGVKDLRTPMAEVSKDVLLIFGLYCGVMLLFVMFVLKKTEQQKREKLAWTVVASSVLFLTIIAKIFVS